MDSGNEQRRVLELFRTLYALPWDSEDRPSRYENLTDILEIIAVFLRLKPSYLYGQGFHNEALIPIIERIASRFGLMTVRTLGVRSYQHREPNFDPAIKQWDLEDQDRKRSEGKNILWVYRDPSVLSLIQETIEGRISCAQALGYPECCTTDYYERGMKEWERLIEGYKRTYNASSPEEVIALLKQDAAVAIEMDPGHSQMRQSSKLFPYVQFEACPQCLQNRDSEAARINLAMRDLAFSISPVFGREIWQACYTDYGVMNVSRIPRNQLCPCGGGKKFKNCCGKE